MGFLEDFKADLQQLQVESQRDLVVHVLRARVGEMTFDELRAVLSSPLGRGLGSTRVGEVLAVGTPTATSPRQPAASTKPKSKSKKGRAKIRRKRPTKAGRVAAVRKDVRPAVLARLQSASKPLNPVGHRINASTKMGFSFLLAEGWLEFGEAVEHVDPAAVGWAGNDGGRQ